MQGSYSLKKVEPDVQKQCCGQGLKLNIFILNLYFFFVMLVREKQQISNMKESTILNHKLRR